MEKLLEKLGLKPDATEEEALAKVEELEKQKSKAESDNKELSASVEGLKATNETLKESYKALVEQNQGDKDEPKDDDIMLELAK